MATPEQLAFMRDHGRVSTVIEMRAMARSERQRALVELKAVDEAYPLLGRVAFARLPGGATAAEALAQRDGVWGAALERATMTRLGVGLGDTIRSARRASWCARASTASPTAPPTRSRSVRA